MVVERLPDTRLDNYQLPAEGGRAVPEVELQGLEVSRLPTSAPWRQNGAEGGDRPFYGRFCLFCWLVFCQDDGGRSSGKKPAGVSAFLF